MPPLTHPNRPAWAKLIREGDRFLQTAVNGSRRPEIFSNELRYGILTMAVEKYLAGVFSYHRCMPEGHTLASLATGADRITPMTASLRAGIQRIESFEELCSLETYRRTAPGDEVLQAMLQTGEEVRGYAVSVLNPTEPTEEKR
ncbi:MAG: hypothetical protein ACK2U9_12580 [Anaerolineae bacterium]|nr:hypothetical protein [Desulfobacteraceae bacterium]